MKNEAYKKLTDEFKKSFAEKIASLEFIDFVSKVKEASDTDSGTFKVIVSTEDQDRQRESVLLSGWDLSFFKLNPVVLWAHDYGSLPIGVCTSIEVIDGKLVAEGKFAPTEFAQQVRKLYDLGMVRTTSVGFIPKEFDVNNNDIITRAELLEFSFVPVPANPYALSLRQVAELGLDMPFLKTKGMEFEVKADPAVTSTMKEKVSSAISAYKDICLAGYKVHSDNYAKCMDSFKEVLKGGPAAVSFSDAFQKYCDDCVAEDVRFTADMTGCYETFMKAMDELMKDYVDGEGTGDDVGGNPTADQVRMQKAIAEVITHLTSSLTALKDYAGSEGGKAVADTDVKGDDSDKGSKNSQDEVSSEIEKFLKDKELVKTIDIALGKVLRAYNRVDRYTKAK